MTQASMSADIVGYGLGWLAIVWISCPLARDHGIEVERGVPGRTQPTLRTRREPCSIVETECSEMAGRKTLMRRVAKMGRAQQNCPPRSASRKTMFKRKCRRPSMGSVCEGIFDPL